MNASGTKTGRHGKNVVLTSLVILSILSTVLISSLPGGNLINIAIAGALVGLAVIYLIIGRRELWISGEILIVIAWLGYALIPSIFAPNQEQAMFKAISMLQLIILSLVMLQVSIWKGSSKFIIWGYVIAVCASYLVTFTALNEIISEIQQEADIEGAGSVVRTASTLVNANTFGVAAVLGQALVIALLTMKSSSTIERLIAIICYVILAGAVINSGSRTALVGMLFIIAGLPWVFSLWRLQNLGRLVKWLLISALLLTGIYYATKDIEAVRERFETIVIDSKIEDRFDDLIAFFQKQDDEEMIERSGESIENRLDLARMAWDVVNNYPFGVGLDNFSEFSGVYAHSNYLELLATTGFAGLLIYYAMYFLLTFKSLRMWVHFKRNGLPKALALGIFALALMDLANVSYYVKPVWIFLVAIIATAEILRRQAVLIARHQRHLRKNTNAVPAG